jgi:hypothetical protein
MHRFRRSSRDYLSITLIEVQGPTYSIYGGNLDLYFQFLNQSSRVKLYGNVNVSNVEFKLKADKNNGDLIVNLWTRELFFMSENLGRVTIPLDFSKNKKPLKNWHSIPVMGIVVKFLLLVEYLPYKSEQLEENWVILNPSTSANIKPRTPISTTPNSTTPSTDTTTTQTTTSTTPTTTTTSNASTSISPNYILLSPSGDPVMNPLHPLHGELVSLESKSQREIPAEELEKKVTETQKEQTYCDGCKLARKERHRYPLDCGHTHCDLCIESIVEFESQSYDCLVCGKALPLWVLKEVFFDYQFQDFLRKQQLETVADTPTSTRCPSCSCAPEQTPPSPSNSNLCHEEDVSNIDRTQYCCKKCGTEYCTKCSVVPYHFNHTCQSYRDFLSS